MIVTDLPEKPSELLRLAIAEAQRLEAEGKVTLNMRKWFENLDNGCQVCLAGALMFKYSVGHKYLDEQDFDKPSKFRAIDYLRQFKVREACQCLGFKYYGIDFSKYQESEFYEENLRADWSKYQEVITELESLNL